MPIVLEATGLHKQVEVGGEPVRILQGVDLRVQEGEFVAIWGASGSGKTTLLNLLGGLEPLGNGEVHLAGKRLSVLSEAQAASLRRQQVGFIFQEVDLIPTLTAEENILLPLIIDGQNTRSFADRLDRLLRLVELTLRRRHRPDQLSAPERHRVALVRAMISQPAVVIADEPTGGLDSILSAEILEILRRACDELGQTIILGTHDPAVAAFADRVIFIKNGYVFGELDLKEKDFDDTLAEILAAIQQYKV
jgi:putative ABC transport system ATP-binding protein